MGKNMTSKFRTLRNLRGYNDAEGGFPPSVVDDSEYEDINVLVARFQRGDVNLGASRPVHFDGAGSPEELMAAASPLAQDGADLADVGPIMSGIEERQNERKRAKAKPKEEKPAPTPKAEEKPKDEAPKAS